jgi:hypothetical protein
MTTFRCLFMFHDCSLFCGVNIKSVLDPRGMIVRIMIYGTVVTFQLLVGS